MKVTVVTVAYNSAATIAETLASVAAQTHGALEHIVVDGGSTDATLAMVAAHGRHVARLVSEPDRGIYDAMNKGLALASGELVGFLNADDVFAAPTVVAQLAAAAERDDADAVYGDLVYVRQADARAVVRSWRSGSFRRWQLRLGWMPPHPTFYARGRLLARVGGFDTGLRISADYDFMLRCLTQPGLRLSYVPAVLVRMRLGGASNRSLANLARKSREDLLAMRRNGVGGWGTLLCKNLSKLPQFARRPADAP